ncbi:MULTISPECIES: hypothetical protein [Mycobacterium avium complex (MAC)]|uniref:hypothetical protein n=1 Tax=Mycobacterium avium complex (MAC) TaxID=120793 RepID=UPI000A027536|nr:MULTISPECIES: hypothetical protein [Mycobacterium avium complex (MAC)]UCN12720.1 hypothetical protein LFT50_29965 [Mycobacterium intracellulare subsp. chimaera]
MTANALRATGHDDPAVTEALAQPPVLKSVARIADESPTATAADDTDELNFVATETNYSVEVTQQAPGLPFTIRFVCSETGWYADGYEEHASHDEYEQTLHVPLPQVFDVVNAWLIAEHQMAVLPHSWEVNTLDADNRLSLHGRAAAARLLTQAAR